MESRSWLRSSNGDGKKHAIAFSRANDGTYYETTNYAVAESHEPGTTFKLVDLMVIRRQSG
jgi:cell division protein FtsI (penicillin-binding protein 3)